MVALGSANRIFQGGSAGLTPHTFCIRSKISALATGIHVEKDLEEHLGGRCGRGTDDCMIGTPKDFWEWGGGEIPEHQLDATGVFGSSLAAQAHSAVQLKALGFLRVL